MSKMIGMNPDEVELHRAALTGQLGALNAAESEIGRVRLASLNPANYFIPAGAMILAPTAVLNASTAIALIAEARANAEALIGQLVAQIAQQREASQTDAAGVSISSGTPGAKSNHFDATASVGPDFLVANASMYGMAGTEGGQTGKVTYGPLSMSEKTEGFAGAQGDGKAHLDIQPDKVDGSMNLSGKAGAGGSAEGDIAVAGVGDIGGKAEGFAGAKGDISEVGKVDKNGLALDADASGMAGAEGTVGVHATVDGNTQAMDLSGFAGAKADGNAGLNIGPNSVGAHIGGGGVAGAEVKVTQTESGGGYNVSTSVSGIAGAAADLHNTGFEVSYTKVSVDVGFDIAGGLGLGVDIHASVDPKYYVDQLAHAFGF
jgi:hypothetical protein